MPQRVLDIWWAYYQCEPFGRQWEQAASLMSVMSQNTSMLAATKGSKLKPFGVVDFMPSDSVPWMKRQKAKSGARDGKLQTLYIKQAFGFR